jgi:hypothetical protein
MAVIESFAHPRWGDYDRATQFNPVGQRMIMRRHNFAAFLVVGCTAVIPLTARAQDFGAADTLYASGVNAYFHGRPAEAEVSFTSLMGIDPNDPRAFYFRAFSLMHQGREDEARSDMEIGAEMEARSPHRFDIGKTLERVQGPTRLLLEQYRNRARTNAAMNQPVGPVRAPDAAVLRERRIVPLEEFSRAGEPRSVAAPMTAPETTTPPVVSPPKPADNFNAAPAGAGNPFGDDSAEVAAPKTQPKAAKPKAPPTKAATPVPPQAEAPLPPAPKPAAPAPKASGDDSGNPFL